MTPAILDKLPPAIHHGFVAAYAQSIQTVFIIAAPIGLIAFAAAWLIPHVELRRGIGAAPAGTAKTAEADKAAAEAPRPEAPAREPAPLRATRTELA